MRIKTYKAFQEQVLLDFWQKLRHNTSPLQAVRVI